MPDINLYDEISVDESVDALRDPWMVSDITILNLVVSGASGCTGNITLLPLTATGTVSIKCNADISLQPLEAEGLTGARSELELPLIAGEGSSIQGAVCSAELSLRELTIEALSSSPILTTAALVLPRFTGTGTSIHSVIATAAITLPELWASGLTSLGVEVIGYALNLRALGLSEYEGYNFNSLCLINGKSFGADSTGLYLLEGGDDQGVNIDAYATFPLTDFEDDSEKRVRSVYFGGSADKPMKLHIWANEGDERIRLFSPTTMKGKTKVLVGRDFIGEYWQFKISNMRGADFEINSLESFIILRGRNG